MQIIKEEVSKNIYSINGSVFDANELLGIKNIVNSVNTVGVMGAGIALEFKLRCSSKYFDEYQEDCKNKKLTIGVQTLFSEKDYNVINFATKKDWKHKSKYEYIELGLDNLKLFIKEKEIKKIAIPELGCGKGNLDWKKVKEIIIEKLNNIECEIYLCENNEYTLDNTTENKMIEYINNSNDSELKSIGFTNKTMDYIDEYNYKIKRIFELKSLPGIGKEKYEKIHNNLYKKNKNNKVDFENYEYKQGKLL